MQEKTVSPIASKDSMSINKGSPSKNALSCLLLMMCSVTGCTTTGHTRLFERFESYQTPEIVRSILVEGGNRTAWTEETRSFNPKPDDKRPPYKFVYMTGPYVSMGISGQLKLTFYNDRLMDVQFSTMKGSEFWEALRKNSKVPLAAQEKIVTDRRTQLRFYIDPDGVYRFVWEDPKLAAEWMRWAYAYA